MHIIICAVVDAQTEADALGAARAAFDRLTGATPERRRVFDYCLTLDEVGVDHPVRGEDIPRAARIDGEPGTSLLGAAWAATVRATAEEVERVRTLLEARDAQAIRRDESRARQVLARLGTPKGPTTALYDEHGLGLVRRERVVDVVTSCAEPWIVPADAHYHPR